MATVVRVEMQDVPALAAMAAESFVGSELWSALITDADQRRAGIEELFVVLLKDAARRGGLVRMVRDDEGPVGVAVWPAPGKHRLRWWRVALGLPRFLDKLDMPARRRYGMLGGRMQRVTERAHPKERHVYLAMVATAPRAQGRGVGRALISDGLARCDALGLPAYLECERHLEAFYERFGFRTLHRMVPPDDEVPPQLGMWREPHTAA